MLTHENIWSAIDRLAAAFGYSASGLAKQAGLDPTSFNKSKRFSPEGKPRWPSTESVSRVLAATGATMSDFLALIDGGEGITPAHQTGQTIPLIGFAQAGAKGYFDEDGYPTGDAWDDIPFSIPETDSSGVYALEVSGDSMAPLYRAGDILVVSPGAPVRRGDRVVARTGQGEVMVKELVRKTTANTELLSLNPAHLPRTIKTKDLSWIARVIWVSQ